MTEPNQYTIYGNRIESESAEHLCRVLTNRGGPIDRSAARIIRTLLAERDAQCAAIDNMTTPPKPTPEQIACAVKEMQVRRDILHAQAASMVISHPQASDILAQEATALEAVAKMLEEMK